MAFCSAVTLCFASIFSLVSAALLAIAFSTDNWKVIAVDRANLRVRKTPKSKWRIIAFATVKRSVGTLLPLLRPFSWKTGRKQGVGSTTLWKWTDFHFSGSLLCVSNKKRRYDASTSWDELPMNSYFAILYVKIFNWGTNKWIANKIPIESFFFTMDH